MVFSCVQLDNLLNTRDLNRGKLEGRIKFTCSLIWNHYWNRNGIFTTINLGPQDSTTIIAEEVTMRFIHADQTEEDAEEEDEMMSKIRRQIDYMQFFQGKERFFHSNIQGVRFQVSEGKSEHQVAIQCGQLEIMSW